MRLWSSGVTISFSSRLSAHHGLAKRGVRLLTVSGDDLNDSDDLSRKMMRQVAGAFMEHEKARFVAKLRGARERKRKETRKKNGGRKSDAELWSEVVAKARRLRRAKAKTGRLSYREISARLKDAGYCNERGEPFNPQSVRATIEDRRRGRRDGGNASLLPPASDPGGQADQK